MPEVNDDPRAAAAVGGAVGAARAYGRWLREQRQARSWSVPQMGRKLREAAAAAGDTLPSRDCLHVMIHRWEDDRSGISERYRLHFCKAFQIPADQFGWPFPLITSEASPDPALSPAGGTAGRPAAAARPGIGYAPGGRAGPGDADGRELLMPAGFERSVGWLLLASAQESSDRARHAERRNVGSATLERLAATVGRLAREVLAGEPLPLFFQMRQAREDLQAAAGYPSWPGDQRELYFLLGWLNSVMAAAAQQAGSTAAAEQLAFSGLGYATAIGHRPLLARLRLDLAVIAFWSGSPGTCVEQAALGLDHLPAGPIAARLHLIRARAAGRLGDIDTARTALGDADRARDDASASGLADPVSLLGGSPAVYHYYAGAALIEIPGAEQDAIVELDRAVTLYTEAGEPGSYRDHDEMTARACMVAALLRAGAFEAAQAAAGPVLALPCSRRVSSLRHSFARVRAELAVSQHRGSLGARDLDAQIEQFCAHTIASHLTDTPARRSPCTSI